MDHITTSTQHMVLHQSGYIKCTVIGSKYMEVEDARENINAVRQLTKGKIVPVIVDMTRSIGLSREARAYFAGDEAAQVQSASALITGSPLTTLIANFFIGLNKTKFPTKLFSEEQAAVDWVKQFIK